MWYETYQVYIIVIAIGLIILLMVYAIGNRRITDRQITEQEYEDILLSFVVRPVPPSYQKPPAEPGIYRIVDKSTGHVVYTGITNDCQRREREHRWSGLYNPDVHKFGWQTASEGVERGRLWKHETKKIHQHRPPENIRKNRLS